MTVHSMAISKRVVIILGQALTVGDMHDACSEDIIA